MDESPVLPRDLDGLVTSLSFLLREYGYRINRMLPKDGSEVMSGELIAQVNTSPLAFLEIVDAAAPATDNAVLYARDNGAGKTQLVVRFPTGAVQVLATEPAGAGSAFLTDALVHAPLTTGTYAYYNTYGTFGPNEAGFPAVGASYIDPVFGGTVRRLTNELGLQSWSELYSKNGFSSADGLWMHHVTKPAGSIIHSIRHTTTGAVVRSPITFNSDSSFDPVTADTWYYFTKSDANLWQYSVATGLGSIIKTFAGTLGALGGSVDWIDKTGDFFVLRIGSDIRVWKKSTDTLYTGAIPGATYGNDWVGISPDGNYVITATTGSPSLKHSFAINHGTTTVSTTPVLFWTLGGHADIVSASDGKTYLIGVDSNSTGNIYRIDVTLPQTDANKAQQRSQNLALVDLNISTDSLHVSGVGKGAMQDWVAVSVESLDDVFGGTVAGWRAFEQEILFANVLTGVVRRYAHHRSRSISSSAYYYQPKVHTTWDGGVIIWQSNFGYFATGYGDIYALTP